MAVVINTNPPAGASVHDAMWHVVTSDNSGTTDFKYVFDIYVHGVQKVRVKQFPEPVTGKGYFDAGPTVRNSMLYNWFEPIDSTVVTSQPDLSGQMGITYALRVGEEVSGVTTLNMASGEVSGYNWAPPIFGRRVATLSDKINKFFTNRPATMATAIGENLFIPFYISSPASSINFHVERFDYANNSQGAVNSVISIDTNSPFIQLNIGTNPILLSTGVDIGTTTKYYEVWINSSDKIRVYLKCNPKYTCIPVHFLNRWGMWDTQRFDLASRLNMKTERKGFGQRDYQFNGNSVDYMSANNRYYEGKIDYNNAADWTYKLTADGMTDDEWIWIADLMQSPQILMEVDGYFYPVTIKENNYEYKKFVNDKLKPLEVEFEMNTTRYTQLR